MGQATHASHRDGDSQRELNRCLLRRHRPIHHHGQLTHARAPSAAVCGRWTRARRARSAPRRQSCWTPRAPCADAHDRETTPPPPPSRPRAAAAAPPPPSSPRAAPTRRGPARLAASPPSPRSLDAHRRRRWRRRVRRRRTWRSLGVRWDCRCGDAPWRWRRVVVVAVAPPLPRNRRRRRPAAAHPSAPVAPSARADTAARV